MTLRGCGLAVVLAALAIPRTGEPQTPTPSASRDLHTRAPAFLARARNDRPHLNVPYEDGRFLHDLVVRKGFQRGLEIGTSTGHSTIWIAWAMSKTGGRLTTIEIDEGRYKRARANFEAAGVASFVDARLADAHAL